MTMRIDFANYQELYPGIRGRIAEEVRQCEPTAADFYYAERGHSGSQALRRYIDRYCQLLNLSLSDSDDTSSDRERRLRYAKAKVKVALALANMLKLRYKLND